MEWISSELVSLIHYLLPGFVAAWVFYGLTAHRKSSPFERVVQALIFTVIVQAATEVTRWIFLGCGNLLTLGTWTAGSSLVCSVVLASAIGLGFAWLVNTGHPHDWLWRCKITNRTAFPSEWYSALVRSSEENRWVVLNLSGGRRLYGWPEEWPDHPDSGQFLISQPEWLLDDGQRVRLHNVAKILIPVEEVEIVEFLNYADEVEASVEELDKTNKILVELRKKEE